MDVWKLFELLALIFDNELSLSQSGFLAEGL
jgi:hypothetical protein